MWGFVYSWPKVARYSVLRFLFSANSTFGKFWIVKIADERNQNEGDVLEYVVEREVAE